MIGSNPSSSGTEGFIHNLFPAYLLAFDANSHQVSSSDAELLLDPQAFWPWLLPEHPASIKSPTHLSKQLSFKATPSAAFPPSPERTDHSPLLLPPPHITLNTPISAPPVPRSYYTWCFFFNHVSTFDRSWRAGSSSNPSPSPGTQPGEHAEYIYKRKASWSQGLLSLPSCTLHQRLSSYSAFLKSPTNSVFWKNQVPKKFNALCTPELNIFFIVKTHFPVKGVDWEINGKRRLDGKNINSQSNTFITALWIDIHLHSADQNTHRHFF